MTWSQSRMEGTTALRAAAPRWSLAGDQQLLNLLQDIHQRIVAKCNATNRRLEEMAHCLRDASVNLQNVNNKFLALSNTQFVESRVCEDDADVSAPPPAGEEPPKLTELASELGRLRRGLAALERRHEPLQLLRGSDSDSSDDDDRLVWKPKDLYADRPLPYIIGTPAWKAKWHAGLVDSGSESDSGASRPDQYSASDGEGGAGGRPAGPAGQISTGSSSLQSEAAVSVSPVRPTPSDVAAELARRLGGNVKIPEREPVYSEPETVARKLYKPQQPATAQIFPEEPPPLDEDSSDEDIFTELHKSRPTTHRDRVDNGLFDFAPKTLFPTPNVEEQTAALNKISPLSEEVSERGRRDHSISENNEIDDNSKKPVGGISLFGTNKHAESIGAAILKRNRRKSSTSGDESNTEEVNEKKTTEPKQVKKERDIFDDLFAKSEILNRKNTIKESVVQKEVKADVFSDIFDDIDDIFSSDIVNVKIKKTKSSEKPLFNDDDDLFAEIHKTKVAKSHDVKIDKKSGLFDDVAVEIEKPVVDSRNNTVKEIQKESKGLFDSDSDDGLFANANDSKNFQETEQPVEYKISDDIFGDEVGDDLFSKSKSDVKTIKNTSKPVEKTALFDSDDELFVNNIKTSPVQEKEKKVLKPNHNDGLLPTETEKTAKHSDENNVINKDFFKNNEKSKALKVVESINNEIFNDGDELFKKTGTTNAKTTDSSYDDNHLWDRSNKHSIIEVQKTESNSEYISKTVDSINDNIFEYSDELKESVKSRDKNVDDELFENDKSLLNADQPIESMNQVTQTFNNNPIESVNRVTQSSKNDIVRETKNAYYNEPYEQPRNILRTTRIASDEQNIQTDSTKNDIHNDADDILKTAQIPIHKDYEDSKNENIPTPTTPPGILTVKADIFSDIFDDVPPIFEKPKEPKKSRNVNALFDDDSDDEALFFRKSDVITDEKPEFSSSAERFGIFNDEPPAIDVDFTKKSITNYDIPQKAHTNKSVDWADEIEDGEDTFVSSVKIENTTLKATKASVDTTDNTVKETKKVGKLKPRNFNINVNTLLPGASPKKKQIEDVDSHSASNEELHKTVKVESVMVKSISFDDPEILDNKISKERAKIQVKRRPSTRRARREAVRKSAMDLTDSSFDGSNDNSVKDNVREKIVKTVYILNDADIFGDKIEKLEAASETTKKHLNIVDSDEELFKSSNNSKTLSTDTKNGDNHAGNEEKSYLGSDDDDLFKNKNSSIKGHDDEKKMAVDSDDSDILFKQTKSIVCSNTVQIDVNQSRNITEDSLLSKIAMKNIEDEKVNERKSFLDSDDDDDLFTSKTRATTALKSNYSSAEDIFRNNKGIETLGKVYESKGTKVISTNIQKTTHSIFDDFPPKVKETVVEDKPKEVIKEKAPAEKLIVKRSILDESSDEDDLFKTKTKLPLKKEGRSLFGDDLGDGDDLFGSQTVKEQKADSAAPQPVAATKELKSAETVFVDPLSLFGEDE